MTNESASANRIDENKTDTRRKSLVRDTELYKRLLTYVLPYWGAFLFSVVGFFLYAISNISFLQLISYIIDSLKAETLPIPPQYRELFSYFGTGESLNRTLIPIAIIAIATLRGVGAFIGNYFMSIVSTNLVHNLRVELFDQLLKLPGSFYDKNTMGHLVAKVTFHVTQVTGAATTALRVLIREGFTVIGYLGFLLYLNWKLTLLFFAIAPIIAFLVNYVGKRFRRISERIQNSMGDVTHVASETVQGYRVVRIFGGTEYERDRFHRVSDYNRRQSMKMVVTAAIATPVIQLLVASALAGIIWLVLEPSLLVEMTKGSVVVFITTSGLLAKPIRQLSEINATIQKGLAAAGNIFDLFDEAVEKDGGRSELRSPKGKVEFRNVSFAYGHDQPVVLKEISFVAEPGETIALVGRSGSGKSTLASLIPRFYTPSAGQILIDDIDIQGLKLENVRQNIALVTQQVTLFNDTIRNNIAYGALRDIDEEKIIDAARKAFAWKFIIDLPEGLDTIVGDDGVLLSGGQRQRLAIARAFLKDAPILILDEATSSLDSESEGYIQRALEAVARGRTTFVIAHRLSTIESADKIVVIQDGEIVEEGTHHELLDRAGAYANLNRRHEIVALDRPLQTNADSTDLIPIPDIEDEASLLPRAENPLLRAWYSDAYWLRLLSPLGLLFGQLTRLRRNIIQGSARTYSAPVPVIVVGNINIGGTGKSPIVIQLANELTARGFKPGIVSRGYGGVTSDYPVSVVQDADPFLVGDEAVMIRRRTHCPMVVDPDRVSAARHLLDTSDCDLIISDDGLQHYFLSRDIEIAVVDALKGLGNGRCLPAGPLREPPGRLSSVDFVLVNGPENPGLDSMVNHLSYEHIKTRPSMLINLATDSTLPPDSSLSSPLVHAVAGIGNPQRFFSTLRSLGFGVIEHPFPDHHRFEISELVFGDALPVIMTEKDAIKCKLLKLGLIHEDFWYLEIDINLPDGFVDTLIGKTRLDSRDS